MNVGSYLTRLSDNVNMLMKNVHSPEQFSEAVSEMYNLRQISAESLQTIFKAKK